MPITNKVFRTQTKTASKNTNIQSEIARLAYKLFQERGYRHGHDLGDWLKAEKIVKSKYGTK